MGILASTPRSARALVFSGKRGCRNINGLVGNDAFHIFDSLNSRGSNFDFPRNQLNECTITCGRHDQGSWKITWWTCRTYVIEKCSLMDFSKISLYCISPFNLLFRLHVWQNATKTIRFSWWAKVRVGQNMFCQLFCWIMRTVLTPSKETKIWQTHRNSAPWDRLKSWHHRFSVSFCLFSFPGKKNVAFCLSPCSELPVFLRFPSLEPHGVYLVEDYPKFRVESSWADGKIAMDFHG